MAGTVEAAHGRFRPPFERCDQFDRHGKMPRLPRMTPLEFIAKWRRATLSERSACQQHFLDLCELLEQPKPAEADPEGTHYTFERGVRKTGGGHGWADVLDAGPFRLGIQGPAQGPDGRLLAVARLPRGPGEPAPAGGLRPRPLRGPYELHRHAEAGLCVRPRGARPAGQPGCPAEAVHRAGRPAAGTSARRQSPERPPSGSAIWPSGCGCGRACRPSGRPTS